MNIIIKTNSDLQWKYYFGGNISEKELPPNWNELYIVVRYKPSAHFAQSFYVNKSLLSPVDNNFMSSGAGDFWLTIGININTTMNTLVIQHVDLAGDSSIVATAVTTYILYK